MPKTATIAEQLATFAVEACQSGVPDEVLGSARLRLLDITGIQLAALPLDTSRAALSFVTSQGGTPQAHAAGHGTQVPATWAAFVNGTLAHSLDYDDTHLPSVLHPSACVVPAAMAAGELAGCDGATLLRAIATGIEVVVRLGMAGYDEASNNSVFFEHGQHATSICGAVGGAMAAAATMGLGEGVIVDTIGIAASMASGVIEANRTGGTVKRLHCGWAAHAGVSAALLAAGGFTGPPTALEGRFGFFEAFLHGAVNLASVTNGLGTTWSVPTIFFKPYPANHFTHTGLDAARAVRAQGVVAEDVDEVVLGVASPTVRTIGEPIELKRRPQTGYAAQFSGPYAVALGFIGGGGLGASLDDFTDTSTRDPARVALMERVSVVADPECDHVYPFQFPSVLRVRLRDGSTVTHRAMVNRGSPDWPLSADELLQKFRDNAARAPRFDAAEELARTILHGDPMPTSVGRLLRAHP